jgi:DnaJ-class molecular chaperone
MEKDNLYNFMKIKKTSPIDVIQSRYEELRKEYKDKNDRTNLSKLYECYNILSNLQSRKLYDTGIINVNLEDILSEGGNILLENAFIKSYIENKNAVKKGKDINLYVEMTLSESYKGCRKEVKYDIYYPCTNCVIYCTKCDGKNTIKTKKLVAPGFLSNIKKNCDFCNGVGYLYSKYQNLKCLTCNGEKTIKKIIIESKEIPEKKILCTICGGSKYHNIRIKTPIKNKCDECDAKGFIMKKINITGSLSKVKQETCTKCNGLKYIENNDIPSKFYKTEKARCNTCDVSGFIKIPKKTIKINREEEEICTDCTGEGLIKKDKTTCKFCNNNFSNKITKILYLNLFPGIQDGFKFVIKKNGEQILNGNPGDLIITVNCKKNGIFQRINNNLKINLSIHFVKTITGSSYKIILPSLEVIYINTKTFNEIINPLKLYVYKKKGMPIYDLDNNKIIDYGDLFINFTIIYGELSKMISETQIKNLESEFLKIYDNIENDNNVKIIN